ncbi:SAM-dependent methyltransferase [Cryptosporangium sp. NPDC048952]|uniref:SAM-dependent methyltransferase n=1 Tax=Cryptosporangium sp. NPDC048952 TaxID=3363961 RepID=UPI003721BE28
MPPADDRLPSGSYLALSTATGDIGEGIHRAAAAYEEPGICVALPDKAGVERFFEGYELVEPGVTAVALGCGSRHGWLRVVDRGGDGGREHGRDARRRARGRVPDPA